MLANILADLVVGSVPVAGDLFDAAWKSNMRNLRLIDREYHPAMPERSRRRIAVWFAAALAIVVLITGAIFYAIAQFIVHILAWLGHSLAF